MPTMHDPAQHRGETERHADVGDWLVKPVPPEVGNRAIRRFGLGTVAYPAATALGLLWPPLMLIAIGTMAIYYMTEQTQIVPSTT